MEDIINAVVKSIDFIAGYGHTITFERYDIFGY